MIRTSRGEFYQAGADPEHSSIRRALFARARDLVPGFHDSIAPLLVAAPKFSVYRERFKDLTPSDPIEAFVAATALHLKDFNAALDLWKRKWSLREDWVDAELFHAIIDGNLERRSLEDQVELVWLKFTPADERPRALSMEPDSDAAPGERYPAPYFYDFQVPALTFEAKWYPDLEPRSEFVALARREFNVQLRAYLRSYEAHVLALGWIRSRSKKSQNLRSGTGDELQHLDWLVRYQCGGEAQVQIAETVGRTPQTVSDGIRAAAELVGLLRLRNGKVAKRGKGIGK